MTFRSRLLAANSGFLRLGVMIVPGLLLLSAAPAAANINLTDPLISFQQVSDADLDEMRGKFIRPNEISYFGISMVTSWQDQSGVTTLARLVFNVDFLSAQSNGPAPMLMIAWSREGDPAMDVSESNDGYVPVISPEQVLPIGDLGSFNGAAQANIIAGEGNFARNGMQIAIVPASQLPEMALPGGHSVDSSTSVDFIDGDQLQFRLADNQIGIVMTGGHGLDSSSQLVGGDLGQLLQQSILNSDQNNVNNNATVLFGIDPLQAQGMVRAQEAMSSMKGNGY